MPTYHAARGKSGMDDGELEIQMLLETFFSSSDAKSDYAEGFRKPVGAAVVFVIRLVVIPF